MKSLKEKLVREGLIKRQAGMDIKAKIEAWLEEHDITNYTINKDLTIDVRTNVKFYKFEEAELPEFIQFGKCEGSFTFSYCDNLKSLRGCPREVQYSFSCIACPKLESLKYCPEICRGGFRISTCPVTSMKYAPKYIGDVLDMTSTNIKSLEGLPDQESLIQVKVQGCQNLESLKGSPKKVRSFLCCDCPNLETLEGGPKEVRCEFYCMRCPKLTSLEGMPKRIGGKMYCCDCGKKFSRADAKKAGNIEVRQLSNQSPEFRI